MVTARSIIAALALMPASALAQNSYSFTNAGESMVRYSVASTQAAMGCASVTSLATAETTIVSARLVPAADGVPEHCRVTGLIQPEIRFEVNLPSSWNRRFYMHGNGGFAGETPEFASRPLYRATALKMGFATATTNTGHDAGAEPLATFAMSYQKRVDYAFRAVHMTAVEAKRIVAAYYARAAAYSYWDGCSTGGRQGLISAQRFPQDFDGIVAGAPVLNFVDTVTQSLWNGQEMVETPIPVAKMKLVADAAYARCDAKDGLKDGLIDDPRRCDFDPARDVAQCPAGQDGETCLTPAQSAAIKRIYEGLKVDGKPVHFGQPVGAEVMGVEPDPKFGAGKRLESLADRAAQRPGHPAHLRRQLRALLPAQVGSQPRRVEVRLRQGHGQVRRRAGAAQRHQPRPRRVPRPRRQAPDVFRLGRHRPAAGDGDRLLPEGGRHQRPHDAGFLPAVHGARHVPLPRRRRHRPVRRHDRPDQLGGERRRPRDDRRLPGR